MFNPIPPQDPRPPRLQTEDLPAIEKSEFATTRGRIIVFAVKRGILLALIFGVPLGFLMGVAGAPRRIPRFGDEFADFGGTVFFWIIATVAAFTPFMVLLCALAMSAEVAVRSITRSSRRTAHILKKCLERRFDSHL